MNRWVLGLAVLLLTGCGAPAMTGVPVMAEGPDSAPTELTPPPPPPPPPLFVPRPVSDLSTLRRVAYKSTDIAYLEVVVFANNKWVYDDFVSPRNAFKAVNVPPGWAWIYLVAYDVNGRNIVNNKNGYVNGTSLVTKNKIVNFAVTLPLL